MCFIYIYTFSILLGNVKFFLHIFFALFNDETVLQRVVNLLSDMRINLGVEIKNWQLLQYLLTHFSLLFTSYIARYGNTYIHQLCETENFQINLNYFFFFAFLFFSANPSRNISYRSNNSCSPLMTTSENVYGLWNQFENNWRRTQLCFKSYNETRSRIIVWIIILFKLIAVQKQI